MDTKVEDLKTEMKPLMDKKDNFKISIEETMEYNRVKSANETNVAEDRRDKEIEELVDVLSGKKEPAEDYKIYSHIERLYDYFDIATNSMQKSITSYRDTVITKKNMAERYRKDVKMLESMNNLNDWNKATLVKKKAYIKDAEKWQVKGSKTDQEVINYLLSKDKDDVHVIAARRAARAIPILVKYDGSFYLPLNLKEIKEAADTFGVKAIDWTVPLMVKKEEKDIVRHMSEWNEQYCKKIRVNVIYQSGSTYFASQRVRERERFKYIEMMNKKYESLGDNPGLKYKILTEYRKSRDMARGGYDEYFKNPKKTYREHKKINFFYDDVKSGKVKVIAADKIKIGNKVITIDGIRLPATGNIYPGFHESVPDGDYLKNDFSIPKKTN